MLSALLCVLCGVVVLIASSGHRHGVSATRTDNKNGNFFLDDEKWLAGRSWDKFRDEVEEPGTWIPAKPFDQGLDPAKDPCLKIKCGRHKVCVAEDHKTATCVSQRRVSFKDAGLYQSPGSKCKPCPVVHPSPVCGTDGHSYSTKCKLDYQACISGKKISVKCSGMCPCPPAQQEHSTPEKKVCTESDLKEVVSTLRDWFRVLHENGNHKISKIQKPDKTKFDVGVSPVCKDPLGWMFSRLDTNFDLQLDGAEVRSLYLDRNEPCGDAFFKSCDTHADQVITSSEWCTCFQRHTDSPCKTELFTINKKQTGKKLLGQYLPSCDEEGFYRSHQCHSSSGQCWCVDRYGNEVAGSRTHGAADCGVVLESSGDLGSGDSLFSDDDDDEMEDEEDDEEDDSFVLNDQAGLDDDDEDEEDDALDNDEYLS